MVQSKIVNNLNYSENSKLDADDKNHSSCMYVIPLYDNEYVVVLGKQRTHYAEHGVVYYPIYMLNPKHKIKAKIGVYEAEVSLATSLLDDEGDVDLLQLEDPLLFSYVNPTYLDTHGTHGDDLSAKTLTTQEIMDEVEKDLDENDEDDEDEEENNKSNTKKDTIEEIEVGPDASDLELDSDEDDDDDVFKIQKNLPKDEEPTIVNPDKPLVTSYNDVFEKDDPLPSLPSWPIETEAEAKKMRSEYKKTQSVQDNWVIQAMKNKHYKVHDNEGQGDCFFAVIRDAMAQLGHKTTVQKLRIYLSQQVDLTLFEQYKNIYDGIVVESKVYDDEIDNLEKTNKALKKQSEKTDKPQQQKDIIDEAMFVKKEYNKKKAQKGGTNELLNDFGFMKDIHNVDDLKAFVQTSNYWADHWAIMKMELFLKTKFLIIENTEDYNQMMRCTDTHEVVFEPQYYIIAGYVSDKHYVLVSYKDKKIFKFPELPFDVKKLVADKCMESPSGVFNRIADFRQFQSDLGMNVKDPDAITEDVQPVSIDLYDPELVLSFHGRSDKTKKPGVVAADKIPVSKRAEFSELNKKENYMWRRRLDDSWVGEGKMAAIFTTPDGKRWSSIEHYLLALPFKESHPAVYADFTADTDLGKDLAKAHDAIRKKKNKEGKHYDVWKKTSALDDSVRDAHRKEALRAKFTQNLDLKEILLATGRAKLVNYKQGQEPVADIALMELRGEP